MDVGGLMNTSIRTVSRVTVSVANQDLTNSEI